MKRANDFEKENNVPLKSKKRILNNGQSSIPILSYPSSVNSSQAINSTESSSAFENDKSKEVFTFDDDIDKEETTQTGNELSVEFINELISRSKLKPKIFIDVVYIVEMFNKVVYTIYYKEDFFNAKPLSKIDFTRFWRSILSNENDELSKLLRMLFSILMKRLKHVDIQLFNLPLNRIDMDKISALNMTRALMKSMRPHIKKLIFQEHDFEDELSRVESIAHLSVQVKVNICLRLVNYFGFEIYNNKGKNHVREYLLREKELEDEIEKLNDKLEKVTSATTTYVRNQKDLYLKSKEERQSILARLNELRADLNDLKGTLPIICLELDGDTSISLWGFDCLPGCLLLEQFKPMELKMKEEVRSNWYAISDRENLSNVYETLKMNRCISTKIGRGLENVISQASRVDYDFEINQNSPELIADEEEKSKNILNELVNIKNKIVTNNAIAYKMEFDQTNRSFSSFEYDTDPIEMFNLALNGPNDQVIEKLKFLLECVYLMIEKKYLNKLHWNNWKGALEEIRTLSELELMLYIFVSNTSWDNEPVCLMCLTKTLKPELDSTSSIPLADGPVIQCANCEIGYHLRCLVDGDNRRDLEHNLFNFKCQILCSECYTTKLSEENSRRLKI